MKHNEDSRVKIPSLLHLTQLGYIYLSFKSLMWDIKTNIFPKTFIESIARIGKNKNIISKENQKLIQLSNWLFPLLMNGQVGVLG